MDFKNTNSAVIKKQFTLMQKDIFVKNAQLLKKEYLKINPNFHNQNYERKIWDLYKFITIWYKNYWQLKK